MGNLFCPCSSRHTTGRENATFKRVALYIWFKYLVLEILCVNVLIFCVENASKATFVSVISSVCVFVLCIFSIDYYKCSYIYVTVLYLKVPPKRALTKVEVWDQMGGEGAFAIQLFFSKLVKTKFGLEPSENVMEFTLYMNEITIQLDCTAHWGHFCVFSLSPFCLHLYLHFLFRLLWMFCLVLYCTIYSSLWPLLCLFLCLHVLRPSLLMLSSQTEHEIAHHPHSWRIGDCINSLRKYVIDSTDEKHQQ